MPPETTSTKTIVIVNHDPNFCLMFDNVATAREWFWLNTARFSMFEMFTLNPGGRFESGATPGPYSASDPAQRIL